MATTSKSLLNPSYTLVADYIAQRDASNPVVLTINGQASTFRLYGSVEGEQSFRTQIDVALNGSFKILSGGQALGTIKLHILEPTTLCGDTAPASKALSMVSNIKADERNITVTLPGARFKGIIVSVSPSIQDSDGKGLFTQSTTILAQGLWSKQ